MTTSLNDPSVTLLAPWFRRLRKLVLLWWLRIVPVAFTNALIPAAVVGATATKKGLVAIAIAVVVRTKTTIDPTIAAPVWFAEAYLPPHNPPWPPSYGVTESLLTMQCNSSGYSDVRRGAEFGIVSYDWSNAKAQWAKQAPMDCEERLFEQARRLDEARRRHRTHNNNNTNNNTNTHTFVYRNIVKALPWFTTVRAKLVDPAYEGFFLRFAASAAAPPHVPRCAPENPSVCSDLYHDQEQTPGVEPTPDHPHPDGECPSTGCHCGDGLPCGEYYFDHRNGTMLREWLLNEVVLGALVPPGSGLGPNDDDGEAVPRIVDGVFLDDYWCSDLLCRESDDAIAGCPCGDPLQGPTEADPHAVADMGLSDEDVRDITLEWNRTMKAVERSLLERGAYSWWLMDGQENANAQPFLFDLDGDGDEGGRRSYGPAQDSGGGVDRDRRDRSRRSERCREILEDACRADSTWQTRPRLFGFSVTEEQRLKRFDLDWTVFMLIRGPYSWAGWGVWGMTWPFQAEPGHGALPPLPHGVPLPPALTPGEGRTDCGVPLGVCYQVPPADDGNTRRENNEPSGVFRRNWSNGCVVEVDCGIGDGDGVDLQNDRGVRHRIVVDPVAPKATEQKHPAEEARSSTG